jgi:hypothetical protein
LRSYLAARQGERTKERNGTSSDLTDMSRSQAASKTASVGATSFQPWGDTADAPAAGTASTTGGDDKPQDW